MIGAISCICAVSLLSGCSEETPQETIQEEVRGECVVTECIKKIETTNTKEEIDAIIGFEGEVSKYNDEVIWKLDSKNWIMLKRYTDSQITQANIDKETIKNENITLPKQSELQELLDTGVTYEELVEMIGAEGIVDGKTSTSISYIWVDKSGTTLSATIHNETNMCTIASYRY